MHTFLRFLAVASLISSSLLKAQDTSLHDILVEGEEWQEAVTGFEFTDGLASDAEGNLYFTDVRSGKGIYKLGLDGKVNLIVDNQPGISGLHVGADGTFYAAQNKSNRVVTIKPDGTVKELIANVKPNDLIATKKGFVYFTETGTARIHGISPDGKTFVADEGHVLKPNGITLSADQNTLIVSEHGGKNAWSWQIQPDGTLTGAAANVSLLVSPNNEKGVALGDGSTTDEKNRLYITSESGIQVFDAFSRIAGVIAKPHLDVKIVSVEFAGKDHDWLFVSAGDKIFKRKTQTRGAWLK